MPDGPRESVRRDVQRIDVAENMGIFDRSRTWFVHDMMERASKNCELLQTISREINRKLSILANSTQTCCPICLEEFSSTTPGRILGCCHQVCEPCWGQWTEVRSGHPFCPLCKHDEFVEVLLHS